MGDIIDGVDGGGEVGEWKAERRDKWRWAARNSLAVGMSSSRVNKELNLWVSVLADHCYRTVVSSSSSCEKTSDG